MKRIVLCFCLSLLSVLVSAQEADFVLALDFNAPQDNRPYPQYHAAYLINTSDVPLTFPSTLSVGYWVGQINYYSDEFHEWSLMEVLVDATTHPGTFILHPGEKVRIFSSALAPENVERYPFSYLSGRVIVDRQAKRIIARLSN